MHLSSCLSPLYIRNPYTKEKLCVPCGKCVACRTQHAYSWVQRLEQEMLYTPYSFMVYFDYDETHLPVYYLGGNNDFLYTEEFTRLIPQIQISDLDFKTERDWNYLVARCKYKGLPAVSTVDMQLLLKRVNKYAKDKITGEYRNFKYFLVPELGPNTFRPHWHGLFFIQERAFAEKLLDVLHSCWLYGHSDAKYVEGSAANYVAQYLNCNTNYPSFYRNGLLKPRFLCSRKPPIGTNSITAEEIQEIFYTASCQRNVYKKSQNTFVSIGIGRALENRLFPKCFRYGEIPFTDRVLLYGISREPSFEAETFNLFYARLKSHCIAYNRYRRASSCTRLVNLILEVTDGLSLDCENRLKSIWSISKRVLRNANDFGCSLWFYVKQIDLYWSDKDYFNLCSFYEWLETYSVSHPEEVMLAYPFYKRDDPTFNRYTELLKAFDFRAMCIDYEYINSNSTKTRDKNAYYEKLKLTDSKLFKIMSDYYGC